MASLSAARLALAAVLGLRLALSPFAGAVGQPAALWRPRGTGLIFPTPPTVAVVIALQVAGVVGAVVYVWRRRLTALVVAWGTLLLLAGIRTSLGKILHNDVLLVVASLPLLLAGTVPSEELEPQLRPLGSSEEPVAPFPPDPLTLRNWSFGRWAPLRRARRRSDPRAVRDASAADGARTALDASAAIVFVSYLSAAWWKLLRSGPAWALSDNLRWSLAAGRGGSHWPALSRWLVEHPAVCVALASGILALELGAGVVWLRPRFVPWFLAAAAVMHGCTWLVLGLDYWAHLATVALILLPWARMRRR